MPLKPSAASVGLLGRAVVGERPEAWSWGPALGRSQKVKVAQEGTEVRGGMGGGGASSGTEGQGTQGRPRPRGQSTEGFVFLTEDFHPLLPPKWGSWQRGQIGTEL